MVGSDIRAVIDTNAIFMSLYNEKGKAGRILEFANQNKIQLFSPESVKEELIIVLKKEMYLSEDKISFIINRLPIIWVKKEVYEEKIQDVKVKHKPDKPVEALSIVLGCGILSADTDFEETINIDELLKQLGSLE